MDHILSKAEGSMSKAFAALETEYVKLRTGRAHPGLLDQVSVDYYGTQTPLKQMANIVAEDSRTLTVTPWDKSAMQVVEKAIRTSDLDLNPAVHGDLIRVPLPPLTEERRRDLVKVVGSEAEQTKISVRNIRRDANNAFKLEVKEKTMTEDDERRGQTEIQKMTDATIKKIDALAAAKEQDLMTV